MASNIKQIIYFHHRLDAAAAAIRDRRSDIDMFRRDFGGAAADNWADMSRAHGYHACARDARTLVSGQARAAARGVIEGG